MSEDDMNGAPSGAPAPAPPAAPPVDLSPIEERLNRITQAVSSLTKRDQDREAQTAAQRLRDYEANINHALKQAEGGINAAEAALARASEEGDPTAIARATRQMTDAVARREEARLEKREFERAKAENERRLGGSSGARGEHRGAPEDGGQPQKDTTNLNRWKKANEQWYGVDDEMTKAAHEIERKIRQAGVIATGSEEYFRAIDRQMAQRYPDKLKATPNTSGGATGASGPPPAQTGRIPREVLDTWERMGIDVSDDKTLERMVKNRQRLAAKGILPETPQYGRVIA